MDSSGIARELCTLIYLKEKLKEKGEKKKRKREKGKGLEILHREITRVEARQQRMSPRRVASRYVGPVHSLPSHEPI